jgi:hypothetical protein
MWFFIFFSSPAFPWHMLERSDGAAWHGLVTKGFQFAATCNVLHARVQIL